MNVPTSLITRQGMLPVIPLWADQVATCFDEGGSFKSVCDLFHLYDKQTAPMGKTRNRLFKDWLRAALVSGNDDNSRSQLVIAPAIPAQFTLDQSTTIYSDVGEAFHQGNENNTFGKLVAEGIRNTFSPAFNPTGPPAEEDDVGPDEGRALNPTRPPAEEDNVGPDEGPAHHPPTTITPPEGNTNPATTPATTPAPATLPTTTNATQFPATTPAAPTAPTAITPSTTQPEESKVQVLGTRQRAIAFKPTLEQQHGVGNSPLNGQQHRVGKGPFNIQNHTGGYTRIHHSQINRSGTGTNRPFQNHTYSNMAGQPGWNNNPFGTMGHFDAGMGAHANMFGMHGPAGISPYGEVRGRAEQQGLPTAPTNNTLQLTVKQKMQELTNRACTGNLSIADMNSLKVLKATLPTPNTNSAPEGGENISIQFCNILGWVGFNTNQRHFLHQETNGKGMKFLAATTKAERKAVVKSNFVQPLVLKDPLFASILTDDFANTILSCQFAPKNYSVMKPSGRMGPLTIIARLTAEHENLQYFNRLNAAASERTTTDIERAKAGTPILPIDIDGLLNVIVLNQMALTSSLSQWAAPAQRIRKLINVLQANYTSLKGMGNFQETFGNKIIFQLCHHLDNYFSTYCTEHELLQGNFPQFNIDFLIQGIENNNLAPSFSRGPL
jgi:hypothetical protein